MNKELIAIIVSMIIVVLGFPYILRIAVFIVEFIFDRAKAMFSAYKNDWQEVIEKLKR